MNVTTYNSLVYAVKACIWNGQTATAKDICIWVYDQLLALPDTSLAEKFEAETLPLFN